MSDSESHIEKVPEGISDTPLVDYNVCRERAKLEFCRGNPTQAAKYVEKILNLDEGTDYEHSWQRSDILVILARIELQRQNFAEATDHLERSKTESEKINNSFQIATCNRIQAQLEITQGNNTQAKEHAQRALNEFRDSKISDETADCLRILGLVALERDNIKAAADQLYSALEKANESGVVRIIGLCHEAVTRLEAERGNPDETQYHREQAVEIFEQLGDTERARRIEATYSG